MSNPTNPKTSSPDFFGEHPKLGRSTEVRNLIYALMAATALSSVACGDDDTPPPPDRGSSCVTVLNQEDQAMQGCHFDYEISQSVLDEDQAYYEKYGSGKTPENPCVNTEEGGSAGGTGGNGSTGEGGAKDKLWVYSPSGQYKIDAKCEDGDSNKLAGHINVDIDKGKNDEYSSKLIGSFCNDDYKFVADPQHKIIILNNHLGFSSDTWCTYKLSKPELVRTEIVDQKLVCLNLPDCDPNEGRELLIPHGIPGQYSEGNPIHLTFSARTDLVPTGEERTVLVTLKQKDGSVQLLDVPVIIQGPELTE